MEKSDDAIQSICSFAKPNLIHIVTEVITLMCLVLYVQHTNKSLKKQINELGSRIDEQDDIIQRHEEVLQKLVQRIQTESSRTPSAPVRSNQPKVSFSSQTKTAPTSSSTSQQATAAPPPINVFPVNAFDLLTGLRSSNQTNTNMSPSIVEVTEEHDVDIDDEIKQELAELKN